jgi:class 3 adenylate cyclase
LARRVIQAHSVAGHFITNSSLKRVQAMELDLSHGQRRVAAIMSTDMVGYAALGQRNEPLSLNLVEKQRKLIRPILDRHNGI